MHSYVRTSAGPASRPTPTRRFPLALLVALLPTVVSAQTRERDLASISIDSLLSIPLSAASRYEQTLMDSPSSMSVVTAEDIAAYGDRTLADVLSRERGFFLTYDRNYASAGTRGFGRVSDYNSRVLLLIDGKPQREYTFGASAIGTDLVLDLERVERIEIVRGPGSAIYGGSAVFAVINVVTQPAGAVRGVRSAAEVGTHGNRRVSAGVGFTNGRQTGLVINALWGRSDGSDVAAAEFSEQGPIARGLDWEDYWGARADLTVGGVRVLATARSREKGIPTGPWGSDLGQPGSFTLDKHYMLAAEWTTRMGPAHKLIVGATWAGYHYQADFAYEGEISDEVARDSYAGVGARMVWDLMPELRLLVGGDVDRHYDLWYYWEDAGADPNEAEGPFTLASGYVSGEYDVSSRIAASAALRLDAYGSKIAVTPRAAVLIRPSASQAVKFLYGEGFRPPSIYESDYEDYTYKANHDLRPERVRTTEVVLENRLSQHFLGTLALYQTQMSDFVDGRLDPVDSLIQLKNVSRARARGVELAVQYRASQGLSAFANFTTQQTLDLQHRSWLVNSPAHSAKVGLAKRLSPRVHLGINVGAESGRITVQGNRTEAHALANANVAYRITESARMTLRVRNLFNERYAYPGGFEHPVDALVQDGRSIAFGFTYGF